MFSNIIHVIPYYLLASYYEDLKLTLLKRLYSMVDD